MFKKTLTFSFLFLFFLSIPSVLSQNNILDYCQTNVFEGGFGDGLSCIDKDTTISPEDDVLFRNTKNTDGTFGTSFQPLIYNWTREGSDNIIIITSAGRIRVYDLDLTLITETTSFSAPKSQFVVENIFNMDTNDTRNLVYIGDETPGDGHFDIIVLSFNGTAISFNKTIPLRDENETTGILCVDIDNDGAKECIYQERSGFVRRYPFTATVATDSIIDIDYCNGDVPTFGGGFNTNIDNLQATIPYTDIDNDGVQELFILCDENVIAIDPVGVVEINITGVGSETASCNNGINQIRIADLDGGTKEIVVTSESQANCGSVCGGSSGFESNIFVFDSTGSQIFTESLDCSADTDGNPISQPIIFSSIADNDVFDEIHLFRQRTGNTLNQFITYDDFDSVQTTTKTTTTWSGFPRAGKLSVMKMTPTYTANKAAFTNANHFWILMETRIFDPYDNIAVYNFSTDFTIDGDLFNHLVPLKNGNGGFVMSQTGRTVSWGGLAESIEIVINESSDTVNWHRYGRTGSETFTSALQENVLGTWTTDVTNTDNFIIPFGGLAQQTIITDTNLDNEKELIVSQNNQILLYTFNESQNIFRQRSSTTLASSLSQGLTLHKFPTNQNFNLIAFSGDNLNTYEIANNSIISDCSLSSIGQSPSPDGVDFQTSCFGNFCLATSVDTIHVIDNSCTERSTLNPSGDIIRFQTPLFFDRDSSDVETDIFVMVKSGSESAIHHFSINNINGGIVTDEVLVDDVWDTHRVTSLIGADIGNGGSKEIVTRGTNEKILGDDHNYAIKTFNAFGSLVWGETGTTSNFDNRNCRAGGLTTSQITMFQPALVNHPGAASITGLDYNAVCGACIPETNPIVANTEGSLLVDCYRMSDGLKIAQTSCFVPGGQANFCGLGTYALLNSTVEKPFPTIIGADFDRTRNGDELLVGNVLLRSDLTLIQSLGSARYVFSSSAEILPKSITDADIVINELGGINTVYSTTRTNSPPVITLIEYAPKTPICLSSANTSGILFQIEATDPDGDSLTFNISNGTGFTNFEALTQSSQTFILFNSTGVKQLIVNVKDAVGNVASETVTLSIVDQVFPICNTDYNQFAQLNTTPTVPLSAGVSDITKLTLDLPVKLATFFDTFSIPLSVAGILLGLIAFGMSFVFGLPMTGSIFVGFMVTIISFGFGLISPALLVFMFAVMVVLSLVIFRSFSITGGGGGGGSN